MAGYTKLFESILDSTIWGESNETRIVWITMLAMRNRRHMVESSLPGLAHRARVPIKACEEAIAIFLKPDKFSRSTDHEGRRIEEVDGGWVILNGDKYRNKMNQDERREYQRIKQAEYRASRKQRALTPAEETELSSAHQQSADGVRQLNKIQRRIADATALPDP